MIGRYASRGWPSDQRPRRRSSLWIYGDTGKDKLNPLQPERFEIMTLFLVLLLLAVVFIGLGFVVKWLFIVAIIAALLAAISWFSGHRTTA